MNHRWKRVAVPENLQDTFQDMYICQRGDCKCEKLLALREGRIYAQYTRSKQFYNQDPGCLGDIPLNQQTID